MIPISSYAARLKRYGADVAMNVETSHEERRVQAQAERYAVWARAHGVRQIAVYPSGIVRGSSSMARVAVLELERAYCLNHRVWEPTVTVEEIPE